MALASSLRTRLIIQELLEYIGPVGKYYMATSSLRTLYHPNSKYMLKFSFPVKVTNSMRINKLKELESGLEGKEMLNTAIGEVRERFQDLILFVIQPLLH